MSKEELQLSDCEGKEKLTQAVAKKLKVKFNKRGRSVGAYKCHFCTGWHIGSQRLHKGRSGL